MVTDKLQVVKRFWEGDGEVLLLLYGNLTGSETCKRDECEVQPKSATTVMTQPCWKQTQKARGALGVNPQQRASYECSVQ